MSAEGQRCSSCGLILDLVRGAFLHPPGEREVTVGLPGNPVQVGFWLNKVFQVLPTQFVPWHTAEARM